MKNIMWQTVSGELPRTIHQVDTSRLVGGHVVSKCGVVESAGEMWEHGEVQNVRPRIIAAVGADQVECEACALEGAVNVAEPLRDEFVSSDLTTHQFPPPPWDGAVARIVHGGDMLDGEEPGCAVEGCRGPWNVGMELVMSKDSPVETFPVCYDHQRELDAGSVAAINGRRFVKPECLAAGVTTKGDCDGVCIPHPGRTLRCAVCQSVGAHNMAVTEGGDTKADREWMTLCCTHYRSMARGDAEVIGGVSYVAWECLQPPEGGWPEEGVERDTSRSLDSFCPRNGESIRSLSEALSCRKCRFFFRNEGGTHVCCGWPKHERCEGGR